MEPKESDNKKGTIKLRDLTKGGQNGNSEPSEKFRGLKKPIIFGLMAIVFIGCIWLIFMPDDKKKEGEKAGLNEAVPQATEVGMQDDKGKAYESELMEQKELDRKNSLLSLSDYWHPDSTEADQATIKEPLTPAPPINDHHNQALNSYRNIQGALGNFYDDRGEKSQLQSEVRLLKSQLAQRDNAVPANPVENQLALMEKSYQMAAKYFPTGGNTPKELGAENKITKDTFQKKAAEKTVHERIYPSGQNIVSALYREPSDSAWLADLSSEKNRNFYGTGQLERSGQSANSIRACINQEHMVTGGGMVRIRLLEAARIAKLQVPKGTVITGMAKFQGTRLQVLVSSIEHNGNIIPVEISVYDIDGQQGLSVPISAERSAVTETIANMGNTSGSSVSLSSTAGQQITSDLSKSLVQGISGYFSKKVRTPKVTLKAGYQVFLVAKK